MMPSGAPIRGSLSMPMYCRVYAVVFGCLRFQTGGFGGKCAGGKGYGSDAAATVRVITLLCAEHARGETKQI